MYASFRSVTAKNGKILTPTRTGNFLLTSMDPEFYAMQLLHILHLLELLHSLHLLELHGVTLLRREAGHGTGVSGHFMGSYMNNGPNFFRAR